MPEQASKEKINVLIIIIDTNPFVWGKRALESKKSMDVKPKLTFSQMLNHVLVFTNTYLLSKSHNRLAIIASHHKHSQFLFPTKEEPKEEIVEEEKSEEKKKKKKRKKKKTETTDSIFAHEISYPDVQKQVMQEIKKIASMDIKPDEKQKGTAMSKALSFALCFINRLETEKPVGTVLYPRILVLQASPDISAQYISVMNSIFSAQKMNVTVDACILGSEDSTFLQQAAHITGGVYMKPMRQEGLVQYLLSVYLVEKELRKVIQLPMQNLVDLRASCFETKKPIDNGFVCSVCLSVFSKYSPVCSTCGTKFKIKVPKR